MDATFEGPGSGRWDALQLLTDASIDPLVNEVCLESKCMRVWGIHTITTFMHYIKYVAPTHKSIIFSKWGDPIYLNILDNIPLFIVKKKFKYHDGDFGPLGEIENRGTLSFNIL